MIVDTHLLISQIIYKYLSTQMNFKLSRLHFALGNIKPDFINKDIKCSHTLDESLYNVNKYSEELMNSNISKKEFSRSLGVICHFLYDYYCIYHRESNERKDVLEHSVYYFFDATPEVITFFLHCFYCKICSLFQKSSFCFFYSFIFFSFR